MPVPVFPADFDWDLAIGGWVDLEITISKDGEVRDVVVLDSSAPELELPVVEALFEARYMSSGGEPRTFRERFSF
jgi:hypothetical protein